MTSETLKTRAKRLRPALAEMFKVAVTHSQSLELVAKEENFPSWDAACASFGQPSKIPARTPPEHNIQVSVRRNQTPSLATIFEENETIPLELNRLLDLSDSRGALVLISGATGQGKSTTANVVMNNLLLSANRNTHEPILMVEAGLESTTCLDLPLGHRLILVDEIRTERMAFEVVALAQAGVKVVAILHAKPGLGRLRVLLRRFGVGEVFLDGLIADSQFISIQQELAWADAAMQKQSSLDRHELILRQHGFEDSDVKSLIEQGPKAVLDALLQKGASSVS